MGKQCTWLTSARLEKVQKSSDRHLSKCSQSKGIQRETVLWSPLEILKIMHYQIEWLCLSTVNITDITISQSKAYYNVLDTPLSHSSCFKFYSVPHTDSFKFLSFLEVSIISVASDVMFSRCIMVIWSFVNHMLLKLTERLYSIEIGIEFERVRTYLFYWLNTITKLRSVTQECRLAFFFNFIFYLCAPVKPVRTWPQSRSWWCHDKYGGQI